MVNISREVRDLTIEQLGTVLYHIANSTVLSLDYTDRFKREVLNRVSNILCDGIYVESIDVSVADVREALSIAAQQMIDRRGGKMMAEPLVSEILVKPDGPRYHTVEDFIHDRPMSETDGFDEDINRLYPRQCISYPDVTCVCTDDERRSCQRNSNHLPLF